MLVLILLFYYFNFYYYHTSNTKYILSYWYKNTPLAQSQIDREKKKSGYHLLSFIGSSSSVF